MGDKADGRRARQYPRIAQGGDGRYGNVLGHYGLFTDRGIQHRHDIGTTDTHQGIAGQGQFPARRQGCQRQPGCGEQTAQDYHPARPQMSDDAVAGQAASGHGHGKGGIAKPGIGFADLFLGGQEHRAPVEHRAFGQEHGKTQQPDKQHHAVGHCKRRAGALTAVRQQVRRGLEQGGEGQHNHHHNCPQRRHPQRQKGADTGRTGNPADTEQTVEARHHVAAAGALDDHRLQVDGGINDPQACAEYKQCGDQQRYGAGGGQERQRQANQQGAANRHPATAKARGQQAGDGHCQNRARAEAQQQQAKGGFIEPGPGLGVGHQWRPCGESETGDKKGDAGRHLFEAPWNKRRLSVDGGHVHPWVSGLCRAAAHHPDIFATCAARALVQARAAVVEWRACKFNCPRCDFYGQESSPRRATAEPCRSV